MFPTFGHAEKNAKESARRLAIAETMGLRTNALLDESFSKNSHPLGEEGCKLRGDASTRLRIHLLVSGSGFGIGSKLYDRKNALVAA